MEGVVSVSGTFFLVYLVKCIGNLKKYNSWYGNISFFVLFFALGLQVNFNEFNEPPQTTLLRWP